MKWDRREIKSFRLKYRIETLKHIFEKPTETALFITLNDYSKNDLKKDFVKDTLMLNNISKKTIKYVCKNPALKQLLEGNVIVAQSKNNQLNYKQIIANKKVSLNFLLENQQCYRNKDKIINNKTTPQVLGQSLNVQTKNVLKSLYLLQKHNQNSIF